MQALAQECGITPQGLYKRIKRSCLTGQLDRTYEELVTAALVTHVVDADLNLRIAETPVEIARAREECRFARMDLERRRPKLYGPKQEVTSEKVIVHVNRQRVIDVSPNNGTNTQSQSVSHSND